MRVVCTAGHVDHGKSALVEALTGMHPDRFAEERRRGLTIDLGFAWTDVDDAGADPVTVAFVDLPGHERFIGNMLAGAGGVDLALLVVAADEGWMPQSAEHLAILDLLGVRHGLVALTKTDLVDAETAELGAEMVRDELAGTTLADAEIIACSAVSGAGLERLRLRLRALLEQAPAPQDSGRPRLWVDRSFTIAGSGTVVTGTLQGGSVRVGDTLGALTGGARGRVRGLQQLGRDVEQAAPGTRVAINLAGVEVAALPRGSAVGRVEQWRPATALEARVRTLPDARIGRRGAWKLFAGSGVWSARLAPLEAAPIEGGESGYVRIALETRAPLAVGDRFVLRDTGRRATAGGGMVLDAHPPARPRGAAGRKSRGHALQRREEAVAAGDRGLLLALHIAERKVDDRATAAASTGIEAADVAASAEAQGITVVGDWLVDPAALQEWSDAALAALRAHHAASPVDRAARRDVPARALVAHGCPPGLAPAVLDALVARGVIAAEGPGLRAPEHQPVLDESQEAAKAALLERLGRDAFAPPRLSEAAAEAGASDALLREAEASGELIRLGDDLAVTAAALDEARARLRAAFEAEGPLTAARAKEVLGTSRKFALPLLEELDRRRMTRRTGDRREVVG